jgi:hypothetical protein
MSISMKLSPFILLPVHEHQECYYVLIYRDTSSIWAKDTQPWYSPDVVHTQVTLFMQDKQGKGKARVRLASLAHL